MRYSRYAVYYVPPEGALSDFGAAWLGWDAALGRDVPRLAVEGLGQATEAPCKYGFHGTLKPPFRLAEGQSFEALKSAVAALAGNLGRVRCDGLDLSRLGRFLALTPRGDTEALQQLAAACVRELDGFRAPASVEELARRRRAGLSVRQEALLTKWGYPYVMEEFRFHLTLTGRLPRETLLHWTETVQAFLPELPVPFEIDQIALCGERADGRFEVIHRYALAG